MNRRSRLRTSLAVALLVLPAATVRAQTLLPGTPVARSLEVIHNELKLGSGGFQSGGYFTYIHGLALEDLFNTDPKNPVYDHTTARYTHTEVGIFETLVPNSPLSLLNGIVTTRLKGTMHCLFYTPTPAKRDWAKPSSFVGSQLVGKWLLESETDALDLLSQVGSGVSQATLMCSNRSDAAKSFDFASIGHRLIATFQFQVTPSVLATVGGIIDSRAALPLLIGDSGVWQLQEPTGGAPPRCDPLPVNTICAK